MGFSEQELQDWLRLRLANGDLANYIENLDEALLISKAYQDNPFTSDLNGFLFSMAKARWAEAVDGIASWHSPGDEVSVARTGGRPLQIDLLARTTQHGGFAIIELKRDRVTERQAVTELAAYTYSLSSIFPGLPPQWTTLAVVATGWNAPLANALTLLLLFHKYRIVGLSAKTRGPDASEFTLRIVDFTQLRNVRPVTIGCHCIDCLSLEINPEELGPLIALKEITRHVRRLGLNGFCTVLRRSDEAAAVSLFLLNPYRLTESYLGFIDRRLLASVLGLQSSAPDPEIVSELSELADMWTRNLALVFEPFRKMARNVGEVELPAAQLKGTLKSFVETDYRDWSIGDVQFVGIFEDYANAWRSSHTALDVLRFWYGELPSKKRLAVLLGMPDVNLFIISEIADIGEFREGNVSLRDIFRFGRRLGRIENCAFWDTDEEFYRERQVMLISLARCPFRVDLDLTDKSELREKRVRIAEDIYKRIADRGHPLLADLFMIGYLAESEYDSMLHPKRGSFEFVRVVSSLSEWIDGVLQHEPPHPDLRTIWTCLWENKRKAVDPESVDQLGNFLGVLEYVLDSVDKKALPPWRHRKKRVDLTLAERLKAKMLLRAHSARIKYPVLVVAPNGDMGVANKDEAFDQDEEMKALWESIDHQREFVVLDQGVGLGLFLAVSYEHASEDRVLMNIEEEASGSDIHP